MDAHELARWTRFAAKGGIGKCTAILDCIAQEMGEDLMFLKDDEITVLMQLSEPGFYLGYCEGVVGRFAGKDVRFHGKLKKPVMAKRGSVVVGGSSSGSGSGRTSVSLVERSGSRAGDSGRERSRERGGEKTRHMSSESPSDRGSFSSPRPGSRAKRTPSPSQSRSHAYMQSYSSSYSQSAEHSPAADQSVSFPDSDSRANISTASSSTSTTASAGPAPKPHELSHTKPLRMATSISGASVYSVSTSSIYSEASTATSAYSMTDGPSVRTRSGSRNGSVYSVMSRARSGSVRSTGSDETERDAIGEGVEGDKFGLRVAFVDDALAQQVSPPSVSVSKSALSATSLSSSASATDTALSTSASTFASTSSASTSDTSFASSSTYGSDSDSGSFGSLGSLSELEAKYLPGLGMSDSDPGVEMGSGFTLVPSPLGLGMKGGGEDADERKGDESTSTLPAVAPLRLTKSPRLTPSSGLRLASLGPPLSPVPPSSPVSPLAENTKSSSLLHNLPDSLSPGIPGSLSPKPPGSLSPGFPASPASLGFLTPRQRSPGLPSSLSPGSRSPVFPPNSPSALAQYTFPGPVTPNPYTPLPSPYGSTFPSISLNQNQHATPNPSTSLPSPHSTPPLQISTASSGPGQPYTTPLSPPPRSPLPPLPAGSLPSPAFPSVGLPSTSDESRAGDVSTTGGSSNGGGGASTASTAAMAAASGRSSPLAALSTSLPSPAFPVSTLPVGRGTELKVVATGEGSEERDVRALYPFDGVDEHENGYLRGGERVNGGSGTDDEGEGEGNTTRLSTLDAFRRRMEESSEDEDQSRYEVDSEEDEGELVLRMDGGWMGGLRIKGGGESGSGDDDEGAHSDGEVGIGLSLMGAFGDDDDDDDDEDEGAGERGQAMGNNTGANGAGVGTAEKTVVSGSGGTTPIPWTQYTPTSPVGPASPHGPNGHCQSQDQPKNSSPVQGRSQAQNGYRKTGDAEEGEGEEDEDEDGGYWDDIYDDYRYSRYSLASKRFSVLSKASGVSKASSKARADAPPMPLPNFSSDRPSLDAPRPSFGSDGRSAHSRPSTESTSTAASNTTSDPMRLARPQFERSISEESRLSAYSTQTLSPLSTQFPAVPVHVPVRTESKLRLDGPMEWGDDVHGKRELDIVHGSAEGGDEADMSIEVTVESMRGDDSLQGQDINSGGQRPSLNTALSPLLHTTFGSPRSSRHTDAEDGSDHSHGQRHSGKSHGSGKLIVEPVKSSVEGPPKSPIEGGRMASALRARMESERGAASELAVPAPTPASGTESGVRAIVVDDEEGHPPGINIGVDDSFASTVTESAATSRTVASPPRTSSTAQGATLSANPTPGAPSEQLSPEQSSFLRPRPAGKAAHPFVRTSIFLPHPNAPKVSYQSQGPMYGRTATLPHSNPVPPDPGPASPMSPPPHNATFFSVQILHHLRNASIAASQGPARRPPMTLFARCQPDLNASMAPVPILFSLDPLPPLPPQAQIQGGQVGVSPMMNMPPTRAATVSAPVRNSSAIPAALAPARGGARGAPPVDVALGGVAGPPSQLPRRSATVLATAQEPNAHASTTLPIPREGFTPQVGATRPRSRSFSAFGANVANARLPERSREEPLTRTRDAPGGPSQPTNSIPSALMARQIPPPLTLHNSNIGREPDTSVAPPLQSPSAQLKPPLSPLSQSFVPNSPQFRPPPSPLTHSPITTSPQFADPAPAVNAAPQASPAAPPPAAPSPMNGLDREKVVSPAPGHSGIVHRTSVSSTNFRNVTSPQPRLPARHGSLDVLQRQNSFDGASPRQSSDSSDSHSIASPPPIMESFSQSARSSPLAHEVPLRNKLSLPVLKGKGNMRPKLDDAVSVVSFAGSGENETVQVQDMDFELIKPSIPQVTGRPSQDSVLTGREVDAGRHDSPGLVGDAASMHSSAPRSPMVPADASGSPVTEPAESIDAHRQRELKWMALFPSVPPSQARKNKKVKKLLQEGVPSSVRYLVWCHLTDSKARALPGVYAKLGKRPRVPAFSEIEKDAAKCFPDQPQLHSAQGPLVSLLQAYLSMVPDIQYSSGLASVSGHLLLLTPEEDAFWIFASMMDAHLRPYFSTNTNQVEVDASLFSKALEVNDPVLAKKLYVQLSIAPASITWPWFSTLFVGTLPTEYLHRVWDIFLYDGMSYLFRVGLVVTNCVRHLLLRANSEEAALEYLIHPPLACLPSPTELFSLASNVKLKDDDVRKQRVKMEQQLKRTTQVRPPNGISIMQTASISLPKT